MPPTPPPVPELTDGQVRLRAPGERDIPRIVEQCRDPRTLSMVSSLPVPYDDADAVAFLRHGGPEWADGSGALWAIEVDGTFAGTINCSREDTTEGPVGEIGYGLHPDARGRGIATRAVRVVVAHAFDVWGLRSLRWRANARNLASRRAAWANGFVIDGILPEGHPNSDGSLDDCLFGHLNRDDPREPRHPWWEPAVLEGDGIRLRPWREDDRVPEGPDDASEAYGNGMQPLPERYADWLAVRRTRMAHGDAVFWCVADATTDEPLGHVQVHQLDVDFTRGSGAVAYWAYPAARGRGVISRALEMLIPHAFATRTDLAGLAGLGLHRLRAGTDLDNRASQRVLRRAGFRQVAQEQEVLARPDGSHSGALTFELLATDDRDAQRVRPAPRTEIVTERLRLRPWRESDRPGPDQVPDEEALRQMPPRAMPNPETWDVWLARRECLRDIGVHDFCIADRATDKALGDVSIFDLDRAVNHGEIGYWLYPAARGNGYLEEALAAVVEHAFRPEPEGGAGLNRLRGETNLTNYASRAILLRAGFRHWGEDHQAYVLGDGEPLDGAYYELLRAWHARRSPAVDVPVIDGDHVCLRPWRMSDADRVVEACSDPTTQHWLAQMPQPYDLAAARAFVHDTREQSASGSAVSWCVADPESDRALAALTLAALHGPRPDTASVGYWAHPDARGRGVVSEALALAVRHALAPRAEGGLERRRLVLIAADGNQGSIAVAERNGFRRTGIEHEAEVLGDGSRVAMHRFELLRDVPAGLPPRLSTKDVVLRPMEKDDSTAMYETWADPDTRRWLADVSEPDLDRARAWIRGHRTVDLTGHGVNFTICRPDSDAPRGTLRLIHVDQSSPVRTAELGYWVHPAARGAGLATAALQAATTYAFTPVGHGGLGLTRLTLGVAEGNLPSRHVAERAGFEQVGRERRAEALGDGSVVDLLRFDRLAD